MDDATQALCFLAGANSIFLRRPPADDAEPRPQPGRAAVRATRHRNRTLRPRGGLSERPGPCPARTAGSPRNSRPWRRRAAHAAAARSKRVPPAGCACASKAATVIAFCSNDYLGLADHPRVVRRFREAAASWGVGSGASHLVSGHSGEHHALEQELADVRRPPARSAVVDRIHGQPRGRHPSSWAAATRCSRIASTTPRCSMRGSPPVRDSSAIATWTSRQCARNSRRRRAPVRTSLVMTDARLQHGRRRRAARRTCRRVSRRGRGPHGRRRPRLRHPRAATARARLPRPGSASRTCPC